MIKFIQEAKIEPPEPTAHQPSMTFAEVLEAVKQAPGLSAGVRRNVMGAVTKCAGLMSKAGLTQVVDIPKIAKRLGALSPNRMGFDHRGSKSAFQSNFRRALRIAGFTIMPGRHETPPADPWAALLALLTDEGPRRNLSRLSHVASAEGWCPADISDAHIERFRVIVQLTCLKSKAGQTVRRTVRAWNTAAASVPGWPSQSLGAEYRSGSTYALPWSSFPASYFEDVAAFVNRGASSDADADWLDRDNDRDPLRPRTQSNYSDALRRAASILVMLGVEPDSIRQVFDVVQPDRVKLILYFLRDRTGREWGGHVGYMALVLFLAAVDRGGLTEKEIDILKGFVIKTKERRLHMSERTEQRLAQFEDPLVLERFKNLPAGLAARAIKLPVGITSAKAVRTALLIGLAFDTGLRSGNIVALDLDRHFLGDIEGKGKVFIVVPGEEIKNGVECRAPLRAQTVKLLRLYRDKYRVVHAKNPCSWLFPVSTGNHLAQQGFYRDIKDVGDKELGLDLTPHLIRALIAKIILNEHPGGMPLVQQVLGHTNLATPTAYYAALRQQDAADIYHGILEGRADASDRDLI